jgi:hypothetical protein
VSEQELLSPDQQDALLQDIVLVLAHSLPSGWQDCLVLHSAVGAHAETTVRIERLNGPPTEVDWPPVLGDLFARLRAGMYRPGVGTWIAARFRLTHPVKYRVDYNSTGQPDWSTPPPAEAYAEELHRFPRDPEHIPDWLREPPAANDQGGGDEPAFRMARLFDGLGPGQTPQVDRPPVPDDEVEALADYLTKAPMVLAARSLDDDLLDPARPAKVPLTYLTDGTWIWPGGVGYYLRTHGVPPEPELVEHIRRQGFQPGEVDDHTRDLAVASIMGTPPPSHPEPPAPESQPAPDSAAAPVAAAQTPPEPVPAAAAEQAEPVPPEVEEAEESVPAEPRSASPADEGEGQALDGVRARLAELGADPLSYSIGAVVADAWCMVREDDGWAVFRADRGGREMTATFPDLEQAAAYLIGSLVRVSERMRPPPGGSATRPDIGGPAMREEARPARTYEGPIEPLPGEPPLSLFRNVREFELVAGTEIDRVGDPAGNLAYAAGTRYSQRSLPPEWANRPYHVYRLRQPLRVLLGTAVPWFEQPGGGTGYFLPVSVERLLADGVLAEIEPAGRIAEE